MIYEAEGRSINDIGLIVCNTGADSRNISASVTSHGYVWLWECGYCTVNWLKSAKKSADEPGLINQSLNQHINYLSIHLSYHRVSPSTNY